MELQALAGQARNPVSGVGPTPYRLYNLVPDRAGGYTPYGRRTRLNSQVDGEGDDVTLPDVRRLIGYDETGISSFHNEGDLLRLFRGRTITEQISPLFTHADEAVHLDGAGAYINRNAYLVLDRDQRQMEPISSMFVVSNDSGGTTSIGVVTGSSTAINDALQVSGTIIAAVPNILYRSTDNGDTWTEVLNVTPDGGGFQTVAHGNSRWIVARLLGAPGEDAYYSDDDGVTWTAMDVRSASGWTTDGEMIRAIIFGGGVWVALGGRIWTSENNGDTWGKADDLAGDGGNYWRIRHGTYISEADEFIAPSYERTPTTENPTHMFGTRSDSGGSWPTPGIGEGSWDTVTGLATPAGQSLVGVADWGVPAGAMWSANGQNQVIYAYADGRVYGTVTGAVEHLSAGGADSVKWRDMSFRSLTTLADTQVRMLKYNAVRDHWVAVGGSGSEPRIWHSADGATWIRITQVEDAIMEDLGTDIDAVAFSETGDEIYFAVSEGEMKAYRSGLTSGLTEGTYNVWTVGYFNSPSGRFVFAFQRSTAVLSEEYGGRVTITAPGKDQLLVDNPWIAQVDAEIVDDLRFDVYIQKESEPILGVETSNTIRYAFTEPYPEGLGRQPATRSIDQLPLGRQLIVGGEATTAVFEKSRTALHNGRMWGMMNQEEDRWQVEADGISPEIANQFNRFVLGYTEVGWANLMSDQSFIPIQPTQSTRFTGIVSTPSGLMVMFDNEIFLVTGDPAFGNVTVELYLDIAGCDKDTIPCKVGGIPFVVWTGKIWALQAGQAASIGAEQWRAEDPFIAIAPEPQTRSLLALTSRGEVFRYVLDAEFWMTDAVNRDYRPVLLMLPNCACETGDNTRFVLGGEDGEGEGEVYTTRPGDGVPDVPHIVYRDLDFGAPERRTPLYLAKATFEGLVMQQQYDRTAPETEDLPVFNEDNVPRLIYASGPSRNGVTFEAVDHQTTGILPVAGDHLLRRVGTLSWRFPLGATRSFTTDLRFELNGMQYYDAVRLPVRFYYGAGGETR